MIKLPLKCSCPLARYQTGADVGSGLALLVGQAQAQRAVGHAQAEVRQQLGVVQAARAQIGLPLRVDQQALVVVLHGLVQQRLVVGIKGHGRSKLTNGATHRGPHSAAFGRTCRARCRLARFSR
jgi:hypothetical protein